MTVTNQINLKDEPKVIQYHVQRRHLQQRDHLTKNRWHWIKPKDAGQRRTDLNEHEKNLACAGEASPRPFRQPFVHTTQKAVDEAQDDEEHATRDAHGCPCFRGAFGTVRGWQLEVVGNAHSASR